MRAMLEEVMRAVWESFFPESRLRVDPEGSPPAKLADGISGRVGFSGAWTGTLEVTCSEGLARGLVRTVYERGPDDAVSPEEAADFVGELANIAGGNIKAALPPVCRMSLPAIERSRAVPDLAAQDPVVLFLIDDEPLCVELRAG